MLNIIDYKVPEFKFEKISDSKYKLTFDGIENINLYLVAEDMYKSIFKENIDYFTVAANNVFIDEIIDRMIVGSFIKQFYPGKEKPKEDFINIVIPNEIFSPSVTITLSYISTEDKGFTYNRNEMI